MSEHDERARRVAGKFGECGCGATDVPTERHPIEHDERTPTLAAQFAEVAREASSRKSRAQLREEAEDDHFAQLGKLIEEHPIGAIYAAKIAGTGPGHGDRVRRGCRREGCLTMNIVRRLSCWVFGHMWLFDVRYADGIPRNACGVCDAVKLGDVNAEGART